MMKTFFAGVAALALIARGSAQDTTSSGGVTTSTESLRDVIGKQKNLTSFNTLLTQQFPDLLKVLEGYEAGSDPITILAPSDRAFEGVVYSDILSPIFANNETANMRQLIAYHVLKGNWNTETLNTTFKFLPSLTSGTNFSRIDGGQRVGAVLQPADNSSAYEWEIVFTSGQATRSVVSFQNIPFAGGIIQVLDNFLIPPIEIVPTAETFNLANYPYAITSFLGAIYSTPNKALRTYLNETRGITVFVPANIAFETVAEEITSMEDNARMQLLSYHVMPETLYSSDFTNATQLEMTTNQTAEMRFFPNSYFINSARIVQSDILIYNGVMHIIDVVLDPKEADRMPNATAATQAPVLATSVPENLNVSVAPFATHMPNFIPSETPTTSGDGLAAARTSGTYANPTSTKTSEAVALRLPGTTWIASVAAWAVIIGTGSTSACLAVLL